MIKKITFLFIALMAIPAVLNANPIDKRWAHEKSKTIKKEFDVNSDARTFHGALLDSQLLAEVYLELLGGRAHRFDFGGQSQSQDGARAPAAQRPAPLKSEISSDEQTTHNEFIETLGEDAIWKRYA